MKPAVFKQRGTVQLSYELPHRIYGSAVYPVRSPNGSRIVVYGHEEGLRVMWYGGRSYKEPTTAKTPGKLNGGGMDKPMIIDLSDDDEPAPPPAETANFEDEEDEVDPAEPYRDVLRHIDISLGTSITHVAVPHISPDSPDSRDLHASILSSHIVVAVSCADLTIRLIKIPLTPPAKSAIEASAWGLDIVQIPNSRGHQDLITSISITDFAEAPEGDFGVERSISHSRSGVRGSSKTLNQSPGLEWSLLIASTSCTGSGLLLIHRICLNEDGTFNESPESLFPAQRETLRTSLSGCRLSFNPSPHSGDRASNLLITLPDSGCVKVYQVIAQSTHARGRRGSAATMDSTASSSGSVRQSSKQQGRYLVTLYSAFFPPNEGEPLGRRKRPLDASWVLGGRAILALFEDGTWGLWDLEAAGPRSATQTQNLVKGQSSVSGIQGGAQTRLTISGSLVPQTSAASRSMTENIDSSKSGELAPMTPHTRKSRSDRLFEGKNPDFTITTGAARSSRGSICVTELPMPVASQSSKAADESILMSYGDASFYLPSLLKFWRSEVSGTGTFGTSSATRPTPLPALRFCGQPMKAIYDFSTGNKTDSVIDSVPTSPDVVVVTDHTLILLLAPLAEDARQQDESKLSLAVRIPGTTENVNELLLQRGELGIDGLDNMLNNMTNGNNRSFGKSVGFDVDGDTDVDMRASIGTPTPKLAGRGRSVRGPPTSEFGPGQSRVRLFS